MAQFPRILLGFWLTATLVTLVTQAAGCKRKEVEASPRAEAKYLYDSICAKCHGLDGRGGVPSMEGQPAPRNFTDQAFLANRTDEQLRQVIKQGKGPMPPFGTLFDDAQLQNIVVYIRSFEAKK